MSEPTQAECDLACDVLAGRSRNAIRMSQDRRQSTGINLVDGTDRDGWGACFRSSVFESDVRLTFNIVVDNCCFRGAAHHRWPCAGHLTSRFCSYKHHPHVELVDDDWPEVGGAPNGLSRGLSVHSALFDVVERSAVPHPCTLHSGYIDKDEVWRDGPIHVVTRDIEVDTGCLLLITHATVLFVLDSTSFFH